MKTLEFDLVLDKNSWYHNPISRGDYSAKIIIDLIREVIKKFSSSKAQKFIINNVIDFGETHGLIILKMSKKYIGLIEYTLKNIDTLDVYSIWRYVLKKSSGYDKIFMKLPKLLKAISLVYNYDDAMLGIADALSNYGMTDPKDFIEYIKKNVKGETKTYIAIFNNEPLGNIQVEGKNKKLFLKEDNMRRKYLVKEEVQVEDVILEKGDSFRLVEDGKKGGFTKKTDAEKKADINNAIKTIVDSKWSNLADRKTAISAITKILYSDDANARLLIKAIDKATTEMDSKQFKK